MMVLLSKKEYDDLVSRATNMELRVEERVAEEKEKIRALLKMKFSRDNLGYYKTNPFDAVREALNEILS